MIESDPQERKERYDRIGGVKATETATGIVSDRAMRFNKDKLKWSYVHFKSLEPMVKVLMFGAKKYAPKNWQKGLDKEEILESMMRHLAAMIDGQLIDPESGLPHIGHLQCNCMFYQYFDDLEQINNNKD